MRDWREQGGREPLLTPLTDRMRRKRRAGMDGGGGVHGKHIVMNDPGNEKKRHN